MSIIKGAESNYSTTPARDVVERIVEIKRDRIKERSYMTLEELMQDERTEGFERGLAQGRSEGKTEERATVLSMLGISEEEYQEILKEKKAQ